MWQPDGWAQTRIGVLTPHADVWPEAEFGAMAPNGISIHAARVPFGAYKPGGTMDRTIADDPVRAFADPPLVDDAAELLASAPLNAIAYGFTSSSYVRGAADDAKLKERLERRTRGIPVVIPCAAAVTALIALGATRLALVSPPGSRPKWTSRARATFRTRASRLFTPDPPACRLTSKPFSRASSMNGSVQKRPRAPRLFSSAATASAPSESSRRWRKILIARS
jgi:Arylmalonate decarboxylase